MVDLDKHIDIVRFVVEGFLKFDRQQWPQPQDVLRSKIPEHPEKTSGQGSLHQSFINIYWIM